jgi:hypothetical protein
LEPLAITLQTLPCNVFRFSLLPQIYLYIGQWDENKNVSLSSLERLGQDAIHFHQSTLIFNFIHNSFDEQNYSNVKHNNTCDNISPLIHLNTKELDGRNPLAKSGSWLPS